jgi:hypothetical protein
MKEESGISGKAVSEKPNMSPRLGGSMNSKLDKQADVKSKDDAVYKKAGIQDQKKQAGAY